MLGQGMEPEQQHPVADLMGDDELACFLDGLRVRVENTVEKLPANQAYVDQSCKAPLASAATG